MKNIIGGRGTGKTKQLIEFAKANNVKTIVCENPTRMYAKLQGYDVFGLRCISYEEFVSNYDENDGETYVIDEIESFLATQFKTVKAFTAVN